MWSLTLASMPSRFLTCLPMVMMESPLVESPNHMPILSPLVLTETTAPFTSWLWSSKASPWESDYGFVAVQAVTLTRPFCSVCAFNNAFSVNSSTTATHRWDITWLRARSCQGKTCAAFCRGWLTTCPRCGSDRPPTSVWCRPGTGRRYI